jgi:hypothetical protein
VSDIDRDAWACDVPVSMPQPIDANEVLLDMGSHAFTTNGLFPNLTAADLRDMSTPTFAPPALDGDS